MRVLHVDAGHGCSAPALLAALLDLGVPASPVLHHLADLDLAGEVRQEEVMRGIRIATRSDHQALTPSRAREVMARPRWPAAVARLAADAAERYAAATRADPARLMAIGGAAFAVHELKVDHCRCRTAPPCTEDARAVFDVLVADEHRDAPVPSWQGYVAEGHGEDDRGVGPVVVRVGDLRVQGPGFEPG